MLQQVSALTLCSIVNLSAALLLATLVVVILWLSRRNAAGQESTARAEFNRAIGYLCHELRNPLHVLQSWCKPDGCQLPLDALTDADRAAVMGDISHALAQMHATVNDVLELRSVCAVRRLFLYPYHAKQVPLHTKYICCANRARK